MKTSKKLLSLFLAVVMVVTTCSVGFTAFAGEKNTTESYWTDKNDTDAEAAFQSLNNLVDYLVPTLLGIEINGQKLSDVLGIVDPDKASLSDIVKGASPLLMGVLGVAKATPAQKQEIIKKHLGVSTYNGMYDRYFSYLNTDSTISFFDLYQFCTTYKSTSTDKTTLGGWCNETLKVLDTYLSLYDSAVASIATAENAYGKLSAGKSLEKTADKKLNGIAYADLADSAKNPDSYKAYKQGVDNANAFFQKLGVNISITNPAEALYYYYSADASRFVQGLIAIYLASGDISSAKIGGTSKLTPANVMSVLDENYEAYAASFSSTQLTIDEFIKDYSYVVTTGEGVSLDPVKDMTVEEATAAGLKLGTKYYPLTGWPTFVATADLPTDNDVITAGGYTKTDSPALYYYYVNPATGRVAKAAKNNQTAITTAQKAIAKPYLDAFNAANSEANKIEVYGAMIRDCYMDIANSDNNLGVYRSSSYTKMVANALKEAGIYEDVDTAIKDAKITDKQIQDAADYFTANGLVDYSDFATYLNSANNAFSAEATAVLKDATSTYQNIVNAFNGIDSNGNPSSKSAIELFKDVEFNQTPYNLQGNTKLYDVVNFSVSSVMLYNYVGSENVGSYSAVCSAGTKTANVPVIFQEIYKYSIVAPQLNSEDNKFEYTGSLVIPDKFAVNIVNDTINSYVNEYLTEKEEGAGSEGGIDIASVISGALDALLQTDIGGAEGVKNLVTDIWKNLAENPIETIFNLLPTVVVVLDEVLVPMLFNRPEGNGHEKDAYNGMLYGLLSSGDLVGPLCLENGNTEIGISALSFDLNVMLPGLLAWFSTDNKQEAFNTAKAYVGTYADRGYATIEEANDGENILSFTGIYVADKAIMGARLGDSFINMLVTKANLDKDVATGINEIVELVAGIAYDVVIDYLDAHSGANEDIKYTADGAPATEGLNDLFTALPQLLDGIGKAIVKEFHVDSDWTYSYDGKLYKTADKSGKQVLVNKAVVDFKNLATSKNPAKILEAFVNIFIGDQLNAILDLLNDVFEDDANDITKNIPIVQGLLAALGGFGEQSIVSDLVNGLFSLKRCDDVSFELKQRDNTNFVGFSTESGIYLIANLFSKLDAENEKNNKGIVPLVIGLVNAEATSEGNSKLSGNIVKGSADSAPLLTLSSKKVDYKTALSSSNKKQAEQLIKKLDSLLASLLKNTTINGFDLTATDSILSGVISAVSNYIGESNTNDLVKLLDLYLQTIVGDNKSSKNGKVDKNKVYTSKKLSTLVVSTYDLLDNIIAYLLNGALGTKDPNGILANAIAGIISPDAVGIRMSDSYDNTAEILLNKKNLTWADVKANADDLKFGFSAGDKTGFYDALGESLSAVAAIVGVVLSATYTDDTHSDNYYSAVVYPIFTKLCNATGASGVMSPSAFNAATAPQQLIKGVITPLASLLDQLYKAPASFLLNVVKGLAGILDDSTIKGIITGAIDPIKYVFTGVENLIALVSPTLAEVVTNLIDDAIVSKLTFDIPSKNVLATLITGISLDEETKISDYVAVDSINFAKVANASSPAEVLLIVYAYLVDNVLNSELLTGLVDALAPDLANIIKKLSAGQILTILNEVLAVTQSPTEVYWTFSEYANKLAGSFSYPKNISAKDASNAVTQLDGSVDAVFALLKDLNVLDVDNLGALVNDNLYTNKMLTTIATAVYGAIEKSSIGDILATVGIDLSPAGFATYLTDKSYGNTYSSAASTLKKAKTWSKVKTINWGFKDGSKMARKGFVNGVAALIRPINGILAVLLAEGGISRNDASAIEEILDMLKTLNIDKTEIPVGEGEFGCILKLTIKNGVLTLVIDSNNSKDNSTVKVNIPAIAADFLANYKGKNGHFGTNGYENAIIPILEAFMCKGVKTYSTYLKDYAKTKDNLIIDVLDPLTAFIDEVVAAPFDTVTKVLPNVAYFIDSNGLTQAIGNLLAPITAKNGVLGILSKNGVNVDKLIKAIAGKTLGQIVTDALGINVKLNLELTNLKACNIQDIVYPLVNKLLKDKLGMTLPKFDFATIASHGTIKTVKSAAKNDKGKFTTRRVEARQGEVLIAVLRYVADVLIKNANPIKKLLTGIDAIKKNKTIANVIGSVFATLKNADKDDVVRAIFYLLCGDPTDKFFDYSNFKFNDTNNFAFGDLDEDFCRQLAPMLDGLINGLLADKGGLNGLIGGLLYKDDLVAKLATGLYGAIEGVNLGSAGSLTALLAHFDIDFSAKNVAALLTDEKYGKTYDSVAKVIAKAGSWKNVKPESLSFGVTDRESFVNALCAVLRPIYGVLDVFLNDGMLNLANIASVPGSDCYTSTIVPLLEAFGCYNIKTQYQYRQDMGAAYDAILIDILNPLLDKVEDILYAPVEIVADMLPNLALFFANDGLLQVIDNLLTPVSALLNALKPIVNVNDVLNALGFDLNKLTAKAGLNLGIKLDIYDLKGTLEPLIGAENVVTLLNKILGIIKINGNKLGIELPDINWLQLASHGEMVLNEPSQVATIGARMYVKADQDETLIAVLRFVIDTINYKGNYDAIVGLLGGLLGGLSDSIAGVIDQVLGMLKGDSDTVIKSLVDLLQQLGG